MSSEHSVLAATQNMSIPSTPPTRGATPAQPSASPPNLHYPQPLIPVSTAVNDFVQQQENTTPTSAPDPNAEVDPQIVEALKSKDRIFVLKCGELMENLVREPSKMRIEINATTSYQRMLVHRCSTFYKTALEVDQATKVFTISLMPESCIPERKLSDLVPAEAAPQPAIKIMQRTLHDRKPKSQANSVADDDAELSDVEPSETGSLGGKSTSTTGHTKKRPTIEEREAAYKEARSRIFMGFEEKDKGSLNSSCSSLSLTSSSAGAGSDPDDSSSPATESEWSTSNPRENKREFRRGSGASSSRNGRSNFNGPISVRNPRTSSPSFKYASIYDSPQTLPYHDPHVQYPESFNHGYLPSQYPAPYPPPSGHPSNNPFPSPYPFYPFNPYQPPQSQPHPIDGMPTNHDMYAGAIGPPPNNFGWQNPPPLPPPHMQHPQPPPQVQPNPNQMMNLPPPPGQGPPYMPYPVPPYPYPGPGYYPPPGQMVPPYPNSAVPSYDMSRPPNGTVGNGYGLINPGHPANGHAPNLSAGNSRNIRSASGPNTNGASKGRPGPTAPPPRSGWSYGPGVGGYPPPQPSGGGDVVGPRLSSRRAGNASRSSSMNDDVSSSASSSTSSSSRRTYTSTTSSHHPLPPRPDWAVAITMAPSNHSHSRSHSTRSLPPTRNGNNTSGSPNIPLPSSASGPMPPLQPTDFPPLISTATPERRPLNGMGAWSNAGMRPALMPGQRHPSPKPYLNSTTSMQLHQFDDSDRCFERPPPKSSELFNHKSGKRPATNSIAGNGRSQIDNEKEQRKNDAFVEQVGAMTIADQVPPGTLSHGASQEPGLMVTMTLKVGT